MSILNDFSDNKLIEIINSELVVANSKTRVASIESKYGHDYIVAKTNRGATLIVQPVTIFNRGTIGIRAIHRKIDKRKSFTYLFNGDAGKNLETIVKNGEEGFSYAADLL